MEFDFSSLLKVATPLFVGLAIGIPVCVYIYRLIQKYDKPMCRGCQKTTFVTKYKTLFQDDQQRVRLTYESYGWTIGNVDETALCGKCKIIIDEAFDEQGVVCRRCGTPMYPLDVGALDPNGLWCRPCNGVLTIVECDKSKLRISDIAKLPDKGNSA